MFRDKINLRLQKGGSVEPPVYGPGHIANYYCNIDIIVSYCDYIVNS